MGSERLEEGPGSQTLLSYPRVHQLVREATFQGAWEMFS